MAQETITMKVTPKARELAKKAAGIKNEKIYVVLERALQKEYESLQASK